MRQKTIKAIQEHAAAEYPREACGLVAQRGRAERYFPCRNLATESKDNFVLAPEDYAEVENGERSPVLFTAILMPPPSRANWIKRNATRPFSPGILSAGQKAISVPSTRVVSCRSSSDHSCWATTIAGAW